MTETRARTMTITVDGREIECEPGELLIAAAKRAGIYIPHFCWHARMDPIGACRMCLVHIEGAPPKPQTACTTPVRDGMVVETQYANAAIREAQEGVLEFLLINHPLDCPICDRGGECPLQDQTLDYGPSESRFVEPKRRFQKPVSISPLIKLDRERCILCYRCTRFCDELSGDSMIGVMQRGPSAYIYPFEAESFDSYFSGNTAQICPVGALTSTEYRFRARPWDLRVTPTTCNLCACGCAVTADVRIPDGRLVRVSATTDEDVNEEWLCDKGRYGHAWVSSSERLTRPLVRSDGDLHPVSWDDAFRVLTDRIGPLVRSGDGSRFGMIVGASLCDEDVYAAQKLGRLVLRTNSIDHRTEPGMSADALVPPSLGYAEVLGADHVVVVSADLREELPILFLRLRVAAVKRGVRITVVHPRAVALAELGVHVAGYPGAEAALGAAIAAALGRPVAAGAEVLAAASGVPSADVRGLADALRAAERPCILLGPRVISDVEAVRAWSAAAAACGARLGWAPRRAGAYGALACGAHPDLLPGWRRVADATSRADVSTVWGPEPPDAPGLDAVTMLERARDGQMDALWLVGADVTGDVPGDLGTAGLAGARFVVVQDVQMGPHLDHADVVLPAAASAERDGTLTNWEGRRRKVTAAVEPPGAARADYAILAEAARRLGVPIGCRTAADAGAELDRLLVSAPAPGTGAETVRATVSEPDPERPLRLLTSRLLYDEGSRARHSVGIRELTATAFVELHPADAQAAGIEDGGAARVSSAYGTLEAPARVTELIRRGVVYVPWNQPGGGARTLCSPGDRTPGVRVERL